jgi:hypothetical protein
MEYSSGTYIHGVQQCVRVFKGKCICSRPHPPLFIYLPSASASSRSPPRVHSVTSRARRCADAGDIYLGKYEGWYDVREETFVSDKDAEQADFKVRALCKRKSVDGVFIDACGQHMRRRCMSPCARLIRIAAPLPAAAAAPAASAAVFAAAAAATSAAASIALSCHGRCAAALAWRTGRLRHAAEAHLRGVVLLPHEQVPPVAGAVHQRPPGLHSGGWAPLEPRVDAAVS